MMRPAIPETAFSRAGVWLVASAFSLGVLWGCQGPTRRVSLVVLKSDPSLAQDLETIRVQVLDERAEAVLGPLDLFPATGTQGDFSGLLPAAGTVRILVEGRSGNQVVARGGSGFITLGAGDVDVAIVLGRVGTVHDTLDAEGSATKLPFPVVGATATRLRDGRVVVVGGMALDASGAITDISNRVLIYDPNTGRFREVVSTLRIRRAFHTATLLKAATPGGPQQILVTGGVTLISSTRLESTRMAELFDPETESFTGQLIEMRRPRYGHTATLLVSGDVLVAGGGELAPGQTLDQGLGVRDLQVDTVHADADLFLFSAAAPQFAASPAEMQEPRMFHVAGRGSGSRVLVAGGRSQGAVLRSTEVYTPATGAPGTFSAGADLTLARMQASLTRLPASGDLLIIGGVTDLGGASFATSEAERFSLGDSGPGTTQPLPVESRLTAARYGHQAVLLEDNQRVLVVGGFGDAGYSRTSAELIGLDTSVEVVQGGADRVYACAARLLSGDVLVVGGGALPPTGEFRAALGGLLYTPSLVGQ